MKLVPNAQIIQTTEFETTNPAMSGEMKITFSLSDDDGGTKLVAVHDDLPSGVAPADNELGWTMALNKLAALVEG